MVRKGKIGLDYFSHDTDMATDIRIKIIMAKHGLDAYGVFNLLLEKLYSDKGYYLQLSDNFNILFIDECKIAHNAYILILNECIEQQLFDRKLYDKYNILTSERAQNNYIAGTERRKEVSFTREFLLVNTVNAYTDRVNVCILPLNEDIGTQRKEKGNGKEKEKKPAGKKFDPKRVSSGFDWLDDELWAEWIDYKRKVKASLSERAINANIKKLKSFGTENATAVISKSLDCGWKDLFPLEGSAQHREAAANVAQSPANLAANESWVRVLSKVRGAPAGRTIEFTKLEKLVLERTKSVAAMKSEDEKQLPFSKRAYIGVFIGEWGKHGE